jgi:outer membrane beta-barrel protein
MFKFSIIALGLMIMLARETKAGEESLYDFLWLDPDKKVYVLQNKLYKKENSFYFDLGYISNQTSKFQDTNGFALKGGYYFHEEFGVELFYQQYANKNNDEFRNVQSINGVVPFIRRMNDTYGAVAIWSPFYGKINTFNQIFYFDWSFGAGISMVNTDSNINSVRITNAPNKYEKKSYTGGVLKTKVKFHLKENIHLGLEYMNSYYMAPGPKDPKNEKLRTNTDVILSIGFSF